MPKCKNDPKASYSGSEPSPKGKGYCAHAEKKGATRTGNNSRKWTVATRGDKYWKAPPAQPKKGSKKKPFVRLALKKPSATAAKRARTVAERIKDAPSDGPERSATIDAVLAYLYWPGQSADVTRLGKWM